MTHSGPVDDSGTRLLLDIWHPDCWTLQVTEEVPAGLLGHGVHHVDGSAQGRFTAYAERTETLDDLLAAIGDSPLTDSVCAMADGHDTDADAALPGYATRGLVVTYELENSINDPLVSRGFLPDAPIRMYGGREYWPVVVATDDREEIRRRLAEIRRERDAEVEIKHICSPGERLGSGMFLQDSLSDRQREVLDLARSRGYYSWPRAVSASDLATELDVSESTLLEHLRKAEAKLFGADT